jgi:DNA-binding LytR/AlgR family response regulator
MSASILTTLVVDDEKPARQRLRHLLAKDKRVELVGDASNGVEAVELVQQLQPRLMLLDIQMPGMDGFEVVRMLTHPPLVVFTTAFDEYAVKAFEIHALDYLLKPIPEKRLRAAIDRALQEWTLIEGGGQSGWQARLLAAVNAIAPASRGIRRVPIRQGERIRLLDLQEVKWFYVEDKLVSLVSDGGAMQTQFTTIQELERKLDPERFFRIHRGVVVNLGHIREIRPWFSGALKLVMDDAKSTELDVSREQARKLKQVIGW